MWFPICVLAFAVVSTSCVLGSECGAPQQLDGPVDSDQPPSLISDGSDLYLAWSARLDNQRQVARVAKWSGCGWDRLGDDVAAPGGGSLRNPAPQLVMASDGLVLLTVDGTGEVYGSMRLHRWESGAWNALGRYDSEEPGTSRVTRARLQVDPDGSPWVLVDQEPISATARHVLLRWVADGFSAPLPAPTTAPEGGGWLELDLDADGRPAVAWGAGGSTLVTRWTGTVWERAAPLDAAPVAFALDRDGTPLILTQQDGRGCQVMASAGDRWTARGAAAGTYDDGQRTCQQLLVDPERGVIAGWTEVTDYERPGIYVQRLSGFGWEPMISAVRDSDDAARIAFAVLADRELPAMAWTEVPTGEQRPVLFVRVPDADEVD